MEFSRVLFSAFAVLFFVLLSWNSYSQTTVIKGKVTDAATGEALPYVNIIFVSTHTGAITDFDGFYTLQSDNPDDSLVAKYIGYKTRTKKFPLLPNNIT